MVPVIGDAYQAGVIAGKHDPISGDDFTEQQAGLAATLMLGSAGAIPAEAALADGVDGAAADLSKSAISAGRRQAVRDAWADERALYIAEKEGTRE